MEIETNIHKDMKSALTGHEILEGFKKPKLHRRQNRPKSAHFKILTNRPKSAHPSSENSPRLNQEISVHIVDDQFKNTFVDQDDDSKVRIERPHTARPPTRMSRRYEEVIGDEEENDFDCDPVEYFNRPVSRRDGNIHELNEATGVNENKHFNANVIRDDEEYYMNMDPVEYFNDPNIRDIIATAKPPNDSNKDSSHRKKSNSLKGAEESSSKRGSISNVTTGNAIQKNVQNMTDAEDVFPPKKKSEKHSVTYPLNEQNSFGVKHDKLLKNRTNLRATNQFTSSYGNIQNNNQYYPSKFKGFSGVLKTRPTSLIEQTDTTFNKIRFAAGAHVGNKTRDRLRGDDNTNKPRPYSEDGKLILPENKLYEFSSNPSERVLARYTRGLSIEEKKATRAKLNKDPSIDKFRNIPNKQGINASSRAGQHHPRKLKPLAFNYENITF